MCCSLKRSFGILFLSSVIVQNVFAESKIFPTITCESPESVEGWDGGFTNEPVVIVVESFSVEKLSNVSMKGAFFGSAETMNAKVSQSSKWQRFYGLGDLWCSYSLSFPKSLFDPNSKASFVGYLNRRCEGNRNLSAKLVCMHN